MKHDASELIQLQLISPAHVEPVPDKSTFGRFDKILRSVGSPRTVFVRPRMITVVSATKYATKTGLPVSLVGLHGKDELLVLGPTWALLKLAAGCAPKEPAIGNARDAYRNAVRTVLEEAFWLLRVPALLDLSRGAVASCGALTRVALSREAIPTCFTADKAWQAMQQAVGRHDDSIDFLNFAAVEILQGMFRCTVEVVQQYFTMYDVRAFVASAIAECEEKYLGFVADQERMDDVHQAWWSEWEPKTSGSAPLGPDWLTKSGRNITAYPLCDSHQSCALPRRYSMQKKWATTVKRFDEMSHETACAN
jgi:hypothetical protein